MTTAMRCNYEIDVGELSYGVSEVEMHLSGANMSGTLRAMHR